MKLKTLKDDILEKGEIKVTDVMLVFHFENGKALVAKPIRYGKSDGLLTLKDFQRCMGGNVDGLRFNSPIVFIDDLQDVAREWIKDYRDRIDELERLDKEYEAEDIIADRPSSARPNIIEEIMSLRGSIAWIKDFFNLEDE